jgi:tetratricopeptide (TPR) repeat protein
MKLLELTGYSGDRTKGILDLKVATSLKEGLRYKLAVVSVASFNLLFETFFGIGKGDLDWCYHLLENLTRDYPESGFILLFAGRLKQIKGNTHQAMECFTKSIALQTEWSQMNNVSLFELIWCYGISRNWKEAAKYAHTMGSQCNWSPCINQLQYAVFTFMRMKEEKDQGLEQEVTHAMELIPKLRKRYAGKTIPLEKFAIQLSEKYTRRGGHLILPAYEMFYFFNVFSHTGGLALHLDPIISDLNQALDNLIVKNGKRAGDDEALLNLLKGVCFRYKGMFTEAVACFREVLENESRVQWDLYIPPRAALELGVTYIQMGLLEEGRHWLRRVRDEYKGYQSGDALTLIRIHVAFRDLKQKEREEEMMPSSAPSSPS